jgi:hypothetical protein
VATEGTIWGNRDAGSAFSVRNGKNFSYPGYSELLVGFPDDRVDSNAKRTNPNRTVLEWLAGLPDFAGRVEVVGSRDVFPWIVAAERSGLPVNAGWQAVDPGSGDRDSGDAGSGDPAVRMLDALMADTTREWDGVRFDSFTTQVAKLKLREHPRVLYLALGEPDDWAHQRRYDRYLDSLQRADRFVGELWAALQADPQTAGSTTLIVTTDHGRGSTGESWTGHGDEVEGSEATWIAILGPDTPAAGVVGAGAAPGTASQVAATVAALLGRNWPAAEPRADPPIAGALGRRDP